jgi:S-adenosylmethionine hydrolase
LGPTIALLTDFGLDDAYVGIMKAVIRTICPSADFIDISHSISPQQICEAAFALLNAYPYFPAGTIFLVVVDPGVGGERRPIAVRGRNYTFVAPDNGLLSFALSEMDSFDAVELSNVTFHKPPVSHTFHGRDIFAPVAAYLACGKALEHFGKSVTDLQMLPVPEIVVENERLLGDVLHIDRFGNIISSIGEFAFTGQHTLRLRPRFGPGDKVWYVTDDRLQLEIGGYLLRQVRRSYTEVKRGDALLLIDSNGFLELAINQGNAAAAFGLQVGDKLNIKVLT